MISLGIDCSAKSICTALCCDDKIIAEKTSDSGLKTSRFLIPLIDGLLEENNLKPEDIDIFAAINGPGSYTGIRIALTVAKTLAYSLQKELYLLSSTEAAIYPYINESLPVAALIKAGNDRAFIQHTKPDAEGRFFELSQPECRHLATCVEIFASPCYNTLILIEDAAEDFKSMLEKQAPSKKCPVISQTLKINKAAVAAYRALNDYRRAGFEAGGFKIKNALYLNPTQAARLSRPASEDEIYNFVCGDKISQSQSLFALSSLQGRRKRKERTAALAEIKSRLRDLRLEDKMQIEQSYAALQKEAFGDNAGFDLFQDNRYLLYCADRNGEILSYLLIDLAGDTADILQIATKKDFRRRGLAANCLKQAEIIVADAGVKEIFLEVSNRNFVALDFYLNRDFLFNRRRKAYYKDGSDALELVKNL